MNRLTALTVIALLATRAGSSRCQQPARDSTTSGATREVFRGVVRDETGRALEGAEVRLDSTRFALTNNLGEFTLDVAVNANLRLHVRRLGYLAKDTVLAAAATQQRTPVAITLAQNAVQIGTIIVEGRALDTRLWDAGYYHRKRLGAGRFVGPEELEHFASGLSAIVRETPRVTVDRQNNQAFAYARVGGHTCRMNVFVDGTYARFANPGPSGSGPHESSSAAVGLDDVVPREDIRAVEIYPSLTSVPAQFFRIGPAPNQASGGRAGRLSGFGSSGRSSAAQEEGPSDAACGAIVIWTKWYASNRPATRTP